MPNETQVFIIHRDQKGYMKSAFTMANICKHFLSIPKVEEKILPSLPILKCDSRLKLLMFSKVELWGCIDRQKTDEISINFYMIYTRMKG